MMKLNRNSITVKKSIETPDDLFQKLQALCATNEGQWKSDKQKYFMLQYVNMEDDPRWEYKPESHTSFEWFFQWGLTFLGNSAGIIQIRYKDDIQWKVESGWVCPSRRKRIGYIKAKGGLQVPDIELKKSLFGMAKRNGNWASEKQQAFILAQLSFDPNPDLSASPSSHTRLSIVEQKGWSIFQYNFFLEDSGLNLIQKLTYQTKPEIKKIKTEEYFKRE